MGRSVRDSTEQEYCMNGSFYLNSYSSRFETLRVALHISSVQLNSQTANRTRVTWYDGASSYLSCSPDAVYVLRAESTLCSQEVQDHLALFNDLKKTTNTHTLRICAPLGNNNNTHKQSLMFSHLYVQIGPKYVLHHVVVDQPVS